MQINALDLFKWAKNLQYFSTESINRHVTRAPDFVSDIERACSGLARASREWQLWMGVALRGGYAKLRVEHCCAQSGTNWNP